MNQKTGILLINVGTPETPEPQAVGEYLTEFLMDPYVVDISALMRWILVKALIVPRRKKASSLLYKKIWTPNGSPLLHYSIELAKKLQKEVGSDYVVWPAMRYGKPSIKSALSQLHALDIKKVIAVPLYPQYSLAATQTAVELLRKTTLEFGQDLRIIPAFYNHPAFMSALEKVSSDVLKKTSYDHVVMSFHGLPERQIQKTDPSRSYCLTQDHCCESIGPMNRNCYRAQCFWTARELGRRLGLSIDQYSIGFQSRLGRTPWIKPFTDRLYETLPKKGFKKIAVICPSFVTDCLETLEEVQIRGEKAFKKAGGESLTLIPCLNDHDLWVKALKDIVFDEELEVHPQLNVTAVPRTASSKLI